MSETDEPRVLRELLEELVHRLGLEATVAVVEEDEQLVGRLEGENLGLVIGRRGQTIDAIQHLAQRIVLRSEGSHRRVIVDADGYRARRAEALQAQADQAAERALRSGSPVELEPMPASERRVVHEHLRDRGDVETYSEGDEPERYLVVAPLAP